NAPGRTLYTTSVSGGRPRIRHRRPPVDARPSARGHVMGTDAHIGDAEPEQETAGPTGDPGGPVKALVRLSGELSTKSRRTRSRFQRRLADNIRDGLDAHGLDHTVDRRWSRIFVEGPDEEILDVLARVFGVSSLSRVEGECEARLDAIVETGRRLFRDRVRGRTYAVRARRSGEHDFSSRDVNRELGAALNPGAEVDLDDPDVTVRVEVRDDRAYLFGRRIPGAGGLPAGVQGSAVALVSGGYDSVVAAWMALRRGVDVHYLFCNLGGAAYRRLALEVMKALGDRWSYGLRPRVHVVDFGGVVEEMHEHVDPSYLQVVLKRMMYRAGSRVAEEIGADALVTGESVGQVSSQTLTNLRAIDEVASVPVLRPLAGFDKEEIMQRARSIGTWELSSRVREYCALTDDPPVTATTPGRAAREERGLDPAVLELAVSDRDVLDLRGLEPSELAVSGLFVDDVPDDAVVIDTRDARAYRDWHAEGAAHRDFSELSESFRELDPEETYVLYCEQGTKTAHLAERMQAEGYEAYSVRGGVDGVRRLREEGEAGT
ncbi:MAG: tRNA uracil 4-sulfurtransferase ThiI, partial [Gemmatimonadota bacterium]